MTTIYEYPFRASLDETRALRWALKEHLADLLRFERPGGLTTSVLVMAWHGDAEDESVFPNVVMQEGRGMWDVAGLTPYDIKGTAWPAIAPKFVLRKDANWKETFDIRIEANDVIEVSAIALAIRQILSPKADAFGSLCLNLGDLYYSQKAKYAPVRTTYVPTADAEGHQRITRALLTVEVEVSSVKVVEVASGLNVSYGVDAGPEPV